MDKEFDQKDETYAIIGAAMEVYNEKGFGFAEAVYQECMEIELGLRKISFSSQQHVPISYKGRELKQKYVPDLCCYEQIIVELKAVSEITNEHRAQVLNYLKATGLKLGLLINFGNPKGLQFERLVR